MKNERGLALCYSVAACAVMAYLDAVLRPGYLIKSGVKLLLFAGLPLLCLGLAGGGLRTLRPLFRAGGGLRRGLWGGALVFCSILLGYRLAGGLLDLSGVVPSLNSDLGVTAQNFGWVALYISLVNSLLEEFFFRGLLFLRLRAKMPHAHLFSAGLFALYHLAMLLGWVSPALLALAIAGLFLAGLLFNRLDREGSILPSWVVHIAANLAINTVGLLLFA